MTKKQNLAVVTIMAIAILATAVIAIPRTVSYESEDTKSPEPKLTHQQEVWIHVLEWCESRGDPNAINPKDSDGKKSYGAFQFRQSTLDYYAEKYGVATTTLMDYDTQRAVVTQMILHRDEINWSQQFPSCVKKHGFPPKP